jgi:cytoskeletal protein RodZ
MNSLGDYFKQAREKKGLSLEHIVSQTRIQEYHLQALESEDFANLPAKVFTKGFVRSYAKVLGLDEDEALQYFLEASGTFYEQHQPEQSHVNVLLEADPRQKINWTLALSIIVVIAIGVVWYGFPQQQESQIVVSEPEVSAPIEPIEAIEKPIPLQSDSQEHGPLIPIETAPIPPSPSALEAAQPTPEPIPTAPADPIPPTPPTPLADSSRVDDAHILEIEASQLTWVVVQSDEQTPNEALLQPGQRVTWKAQKQFLLTLGNAAGVVVRLNGESRGPFGNPGQVVREIRLRP